MTGKYAVDDLAVPRISSKRPAKVIVNYLGYPGTPTSAYKG